MYKVLIVDDKSLIRRGISSSINWHELNIEPAGEAENGEQAMEIISKVRPDIVITDIRMPDMDGLDLLKNISEFDNRIIRIVISGYDEFDYAKKAIKYGSIDYIMKPVDPAELNESIKKACSILDRNKLYAPDSEQMLKDLFQKLIKQIGLNRQDYRAIIEEYNLEKSFFCIAMIKNKSGEDVLKGFMPKLNALNVCFIEEGNGITALVFFTGNTNMSINNFEIIVRGIVEKALAGYRCEEIIAGVGEPVESIDCLIDAYRTACQASLYCLLSEKENIIFHPSIKNRKPCIIKPDEYESELIINVTTGNSNKSALILEELLEKVLRFPDVSLDSIRLLFSNLCYMLLKLNVDFEAEIHEFLYEINHPENLLRYESIYDAAQIIYNFYSLAAKKYMNEAGGKNAIVAKVKDFIEKNYFESISLNMLSELFHMNASYLTRIFKEAEGYSINEYIVKVRIENAKRVLESGKVNIRKLAESIGYENSTYFFKVFKKATGMTPREYFIKNKKS